MTGHIWHENPLYKHLRFILDRSVPEPEVTLENKVIKQNRTVVVYTLYNEKCSQQHNDDVCSVGQPLFEKTLSDNSFFTSVLYDCVHVHCAVAL